MQNQTFRLFLYSALAIVALALAWGWHSIPRQGRLAEEQLRTSLEQEMIVLTSAVKSSTSALKYRLLDVLKAEGNDHATRSFQDSVFVSAALLEWEGNSWKVNWHSTKLKEEFQTATLRGWMNSWPMAKLTAGDETFFAKVADVQGQSYFAMAVPVRRPNNVPMLGIGVFPAAQFGLTFAADQARELRVFDDKGFALALAHPAYLGASLRRENVVAEILEGESLSVRQEWKSEGGTTVLGLAQRLSDSNLFAAVETKIRFKNGWQLQSWLYLLLCAAGAIALNWVLFASLMRPMLDQLAQSDEVIEDLRRHLQEQAEVSSAPELKDTRPTPDLTKAEPAISGAQLPQIDFVESQGADAPPVHSIKMDKVVTAALRTLEPRLREAGIAVQQHGLERTPVAADILQLQTAVEEVLKNSIEAMQGSAQRRLSVAARCDGKKVTLCVEDSGHGISSDNLDKIFDPFFSTKDAQGVARGLGLNVVRRVLEELHGQVQIRNRADGQGVIVEMSWPQEVTEVQAVPASPQESSPSEELSKDLAFLSNDGEEEFQMPVRAERELPNIEIRKPKVRMLEN